MTDRMTSRERVQLALSHREADRVAVQGLPWFSTVERWSREGLPADVTPAQYFGYEMAAIHPRAHRIHHHVAPGRGGAPRPPDRVMALVGTYGSY